jgi:ssDNA-specific exonuclease RecJ
MAVMKDLFIEKKEIEENIVYQELCRIANLESEITTEEIIEINNNKVGA